MLNRFDNWQYPNLEEGKLSKYNWIVQHIGGLMVGYRTDIGAFSYITAKTATGSTADIKALYANISLVLI